MAFGGFVDYYDGDDEAARWTVSREHALAWDLANIEAQIETLERTPTLKRMKADGPPQPTLARPRETEVGGGPPPRPYLPPGVPVNLAGLAELRARERAE
jgi:hypothetical protein